jgi:eukaryotic-like serine/threonine-protein kinase
MPLIPGTILGQYEVRAPLGAGGMGEVYRAYDSRLDREVAIKVLPESLTSDPQRLQRFEQEARAAAALNHPNILAVYQMSTHQGGISYLVTELLEGETLREKLKRGPMPLRKVIDYAVQIARGLAAPHEKGIVHRDLKPENLFVTNDGRVKILDFGLAKMNQANASAADATLTQQTDPGVVMGTVGYMSPEQVRGRISDHRSDIFAFGAILYEMVTGKQTFHKPTSAETMTAILNEDPKPISQVSPATSPGLQRVVHRCLEKNPEQRFQSASDLAFALEALSDSTLTPLSGKHAQHDGRSPGVRATIFAGSMMAAIAIAVVTYVWTQPPATPKLSNYVQLTHDGKPKALVGEDGSRIYLFDGSNGASISEMSTTGGEQRGLPIFTTPTMFPIWLSHDGSQLLVVDGIGVPTKGPLFSVPVLGGSPRRLGEAVGQGGRWSDDGKQLAYVNGNELFLANGDGTNPRKLVTMKQVTLLVHPLWTPDGKHLRFDAGFDIGVSIWEVGLDGTGLHQVLPDPPDRLKSDCCGSWTPDRRHFIYRQNGQLWAIRNGGGFLQPKPKPVQLTSSPVTLTYYVLGKDGKKVYVVGRTNRGELVRYNVKANQFEPFLGGISAEYSDFSRDGQWVAYISFPEGTLWRSKIDGTERLQLTYPPNYTMMPKWSPDGKRIAFFETFPDGTNRMYEVPRDGGTPRELLPEDHGAQSDPNWSPDGSKIVFGANANDQSATIRILDLTTHHVSELPGSKGMFSPRWSPDGKYISAFSADLSRLLVFDLQTQKWKELAKGILSWLNFTKDGQHLVFVDQSGTGSIVQVRTTDGNVERKLDLKGFSPAGRFNNSLSLAPDDSPLILRDAGTQDVYSLDWEEH